MILDAELEAADASALEYISIELGFGIIKNKTSSLIQELVEKMLAGSAGIAPYEKAVHH